MRYALYTVTADENATFYTWLAIVSVCSNNGSENDTLVSSAHESIVYPLSCVF